MSTFPVVRLSLLVRRSRTAIVLLFVLALGLGLTACQNGTGAQETGREPDPDSSPATDGPSIEDKLAEMGLELPEVSPPVANYVRAVRTGNLVFLAGHGPLTADGSYITGKVDSELTIEEGYQAAQRTALALLASLKAELGDLDRVQRIVRVFGMVNSDPDFTQQPQVINGCSDLLVDLYGDRGRHARAAVGMVSLPIGIAVEIEMVVEVE